MHPSTEVKLSSVKSLPYLWKQKSYITLFWITGVFTAAFDSGIEWLIVKVIADYAVSSSAQQNAKSWRRCACVMAASLVMHILSNPTVFRSWPHYKGNFDKTLVLFCLFVSILLRFFYVSQLQKCC